MNKLDQVFHIWDVLYDKKQDPESAIEEYLHEDYIQSINGVTMNRSAFLNHVIEQRKNLSSMNFIYKNHLTQSDKLFIIYDAKGKNLQGDEITAEIISYFEFKDDKLFKIHGQVHLSQGNPKDVDMKADKL